MSKQEYADRKLEYQRKQVKQLSKNKDSRYYEQLHVLNMLESDDYYLYGEKFDVTEDKWLNKYHNFLSNVVRSPWYEEELEALEEL